MKAMCSFCLVGLTMLATRMAVAVDAGSVPGSADNFVAGKAIRESAVSEGVPRSADAVPKGLAKSDWESIRAAYEAGRHAFQPVAGCEGVWQARNPGQQWLTQFDGRGFLTQPRDGAWEWGFALKSYGFPGAERVLEGSPVVKADGMRLTYGWDGALEEWFVNDTRGLEHGFTVRARPEGARDGEWLRFDLRVLGTLAPRVAGDGQGVRFHDAAGESVVNYSGLKVWDGEGRALASLKQNIHCRLL